MPTVVGSQCAEMLCTASLCGWFESCNVVEYQDLMLYKLKPSHKTAETFVIQMA